MTETGFLLVRLQVRYGMVDEFSEIMTHLAPILKSKGWRLHGAYTTRIGRLGECWDLWEVPGASGIQSVLTAARDVPEFREWAGRLAEVLEEEELRYVIPLRYAE